MRAGGINWLAVIVAAVAIYALGFIIYGVMIGEAQLAVLAGEAPGSSDEPGRMPFGVLMPLATALFMALVFSWGQVANAIAGVRWGAAIAFASAIPALWYGWVYGDNQAAMVMVDSAHLLLGHALAGAILGGWR